jgi:hypothetical protein
MTAADQPTADTGADRHDEDPVERVSTDPGGAAPPDADADDGTDSSNTEADSPGNMGTDHVDLLEAKSRAVEAAEELLDGPVEGVTSVEETDEGWTVLVESVERSAVPDTQDIIGRYEVQLSAGGRLQGYDLKRRFRRSEMEGEELG